MLYEYPTGDIANLHCRPLAVEAMKMKYRKSGYKKAEIEGEFEGNKKITLGLVDYSWQLIFQFY